MNYYDTVADGFNELSEETKKLKANVLLNRAWVMTLTVLVISLGCQAWGVPFTIATFLGFLALNIFILVIKEKK